MDNDNIWNNFSFLEGGPLYRIGRRFGIASGRAAFVQLGLIIATLTWLPLVVLTAVGHPEGGVALRSFLYSLGTHARLLVAIPLFFITEALFNARTREAIRLMVTGHLIREEQLPRFNAALSHALRWRDTWLVEVALAALTILLVWSGIRTDAPTEISTWRILDGRVTLAGWWYGIVAIPVFQFLIWRWYARLLIWSHLLWRINRLDLQTIATHPDRAGGLGSLGVVHLTLAPLNFAMILMLVATSIEQIWFGGVDVQSLALPLTASIVGFSFLVVAPLLLFTTRLIDLKQRGSLDYGGLAERYVRAFDAKWVRTTEGPQSEHLLGSADIQSLADLAGGFDVIRGIHIIPMDRSQLLLLIGAAIVPVLPLVLFVIPLDELVLQGWRTLLRL